MRLDIAIGLIGGLTLAPAGARAQAPGGDTIPAPSSGVPAPAHESTAASSTAPANRLSAAGVYRAAALVDSVYVDRVNRQAFVEGGDFASYLVARLGVRPVPDNLAIDIGVDTGAVTLGGQVQQLPPAVQAALGPALMFLDPASVITADVSLLRNQPGVVRFHLRSLLVNGVPLPEGLLVPLMAEVGARYPALTRTGRDLLVAIPEDGTMRLEQGGVRVAIRRAAAPPKTGS